MQTDMNVADIIEAGAKRIETHGWIQGTGGGSGARDLQPNCASNSMFFAGRFYEHEQVVAQWVFAEHLTGSRNICGIWNWNDAPGQTKENVIATMRACAAIWRAKQENTDASKAAGPEVSIRNSGSESEAGISRGAVPHCVSAEASA